MIFSVCITIDNDKDKKTLMQMNVKNNPYLTIFDERIRCQKKLAYNLKNQYAAKLNPFIEIFKDGELTVIYKEACEDPIKELINICNQ